MDPWVGIEFSEQMRMYALSQEFPFPTKLSGRSNLAKYQTEGLYHEYMRIEQGIIKRVKAAYARLFMIERKAATMQEVKNILEQMRAVASRHYALNMVTQTDVLRIQVEYLKLENTLINLKSEKSAVTTEINLLLDRDPGEALGIKTDAGIKKETPPIDTLYQWARDSQPALKSFRDRIKMAQVSLSLARQEYLPDLMVKIETEEMDMHLANPKLMIGFTVPVWSYQKQRRMVKEMDAELKMAEADYRAMENMVVNRVKEAAVMSDNYEREIDLYKNSIIPQVEATFKSALRSYEANRIDFALLLDAQKMLTETKLEYSQAQANYLTSLADLEEIIARELEER
jgi:outer membrane protein TolC